MTHDFTMTPELSATGRDLDFRLHTRQRVSCTCGAQWTFKTDEIGARVMNAHLTRVGHDG